VAAGYWFALFDGINRFYVRDDEPELRDRIAAPANVLDDYVVHTWLARVQVSDALAEERRVALDGSQAELADLARRARVLESRTAALEATIAELTDALGAAQFQTARALADRTELAQHAHALQVELDAVLATKTFRHTARLRDRYARVREMARRFGG